ncbi:MAG: hypothetical protein QM758_06435 [Armatimonas sp.]
MISEMERNIGALQYKQLLAFALGKNLCVAGQSVHDSVDEYMFSRLGYSEEQLAEIKAYYNRHDPPIPVLSPAEDLTSIRGQFKMLCGYAYPWFYDAAGLALSFLQSHHKSGTTEEWAAITKGNLYK